MKFLLTSSPFFLPQKNIFGVLSIEFNGYPSRLDISCSSHVAAMKHKFFNTLTSSCPLDSVWTLTRHCPDMLTSQMLLDFKLMSFILEQSKFNQWGETAPSVQCKKVSQDLESLGLGVWDLTKKRMVRAKLKEKVICDWDVLHLLINLLPSPVF